MTVPPSDLLRSTSLRQAMVSFARRRGAGDDAEDAVQATLTEAWQQAERPTEPALLRRWLWGILRHKVVDLHRKRAREVVVGDLESPASDDTAALAASAAHARAQPAQTEPGNDLLLWASRNLPEGKDTAQTLDWLLREAEGESLELIAREAALPPARVRKRVSRLREHFRLHWQRDAAALAALGIVTGLVLWFWPAKPDPERLAKEPTPVLPDSRQLRSLELQERAHDACAHDAWQRCLELLDEAKGLGTPEPPRAAADRLRATERLLAPAPSAPGPTPSSTPAPTSPPTATPAPTPLRPPRSTSSPPSGGTSL